MRNLLPEAKTAVVEYNVNKNAQALEEARRRYGPALTIKSNEQARDENKKNAEAYERYMERARREQEAYDAQKKLEAQYAKQQEEDAKRQTSASSSSTRDQAAQLAVAASPTLFSFGGRKKSRKLGNKFNRCVKSVRQTVRARKGSTKESASIAICTKSVLQTRGKTMKRYRKGRLITQKKFRGGGLACS